MPALLVLILFASDPYSSRKGRSAGCARTHSASRLTKGVSVGQKALRNAVSILASLCLRPVFFAQKALEY